MIKNIFYERKQFTQKPRIHLASEETKSSILYGRKKYPMFMALKGAGILLLTTTSTPELDPTQPLLIQRVS